MWCFVSAFWLLVAPPLSCALLMLSPAKASYSYPLLQNMAGIVGGKERGKEGNGGWGGKGVTKEA